MKKILCTFLAGLIFISVSIYAAEPFRKPFVEISVNGQIIAPGRKAELRPGERLKVTAILRGGRRDYCSMPEKICQYRSNN